MKLELKNLATYLPYNIKVLHSSNCIMFMVSERKKGPYLSLEGVINYGKPILRHLSDLTKEIEVNCHKFVPINRLAGKLFYKNPDDFDSLESCKIWIENHLLELNERKGYDNILHWIFQDLIKWHFDLFNLIENGLAIDINTFKK